MNWLTPMQVAALLVAGMGHALLGSVKVPLARRLQIDEARVGGLVSIFGLMIVPIVLAAGFLVDAVGRQTVLSAGLVLVIVSLTLLARASVYGTALFAVLLLGTGWSALVNVLNVTSPPAFGGTPAYAMNMGDFVFGLGAFLTPILIAALLRVVGLSKALLALGGLAIIPIMFAMGVDWAPLETKGTIDGTGFAALISNPMMWLCAIAFFFHVPIEASLAAWSTTLLVDKGVNDTTAAGYLSAFWLTFMASRLLTALTLPADMETLLVLTLAVALLACTAAITWCKSAGLMKFLVVVGGLILGPIFPTIIALLFSHTEPVLHGRAVGLFFCIGGIGWTAIPMLIGGYAKRTSVQHAFLIAQVCAVGLCIMAGLLYRHLDLVGSVAH